MDTDKTRILRQIGGITIMEKNLIEIEEKINQYFLTENFNSVIKEYRNLWSTRRTKGVENFVSSINVALADIEAKIQVCDYSNDFLWTVNILPLFLLYDLPDKTKHKVFIGKIIVNQRKMHDSIGINEGWGSEVKARFFDKYVYRDIRDDWFLHNVDVLTLSQIMKIETKSIQENKIKTLKQSIKNSQKGRKRMFKEEQQQRKELDIVSAWSY